MDQLLALATKAGMDPAQGEAATGGFLSLLKNCMKAEDFDKIVQGIPGADAAVAKSDSAEADAPSGGIAGMMGAAMSSLGGSQGASMAGLLGTLQSKGIDPGMVQKFLASVGPLIKERCGVDVTDILGSPSGDDTSGVIETSGEAQATEESATSSTNPMSSLKGMAKGFGF